MDHFLLLGPETDILCQFLEPETDIMGERNYISLVSLCSNSASQRTSEFPIIFLFASPHDIFLFYVILSSFPSSYYLTQPIQFVLQLKASIPKVPHVM